MIVAFARIMRQELDNEVSVVDRSLTSGALQSMEEYRNITGKRSGLIIALAILDETIKRFDEQ